MEVDALTRIHVRPLNHLILEPVLPSEYIVQEVYLESCYTLKDCW